MFDSDYPQADSGASTLNKSAIMPTLRQRMSQAVAEAEKRLADVKRAQALFDKSPDLEELLNLMQRTHF
jgi:hypothetical protein